jgi:phosphoribosylanthranilate isomerase
MRMTKIKLCGLMRPEDAVYANEAAPDYIGFVFDEGRHYVTDEQAAAMRKILNPSIPAVGVFVDEPQDHVVQLVEEGTIQIVQLHGHEDNQYIKSLRSRISCPFIKVVSVKTMEDILEAQKTEADYLLLDHGKGGTGKSFDWTMIPALSKPWFMAGGIGLSNIEEALSYHPFAVDISSGAETGGKKDREKMIELVRLVRRLG